MRVAAIILFAAALASCAGEQRRGPPLDVINRALAGAPGEAQPSRIVATEIAYARAAKENGMRSAVGSFAAPGAVLHSEQGTQSIAARSFPQMPPDWGTRAVAMSCDGSLAVAQGRFVDPDGIVGNYITVWERQPDNSYLYTYDASAPDNPQPPPRKEFEDGDIVVTAIDAVRAEIAECPERGGIVPPAPLIGDDEAAQSGQGTSKDGTLVWRWTHGPDGTRGVSAIIYNGASWSTVVDERLPLPLR